MSDCSGQPCDTVDWYDDDLIDTNDLIQLALSWLGDEIIYDAPIAEEIKDDFETGDFSVLSWQTSGNVPWAIASDEVYEGLYVAKSGDVSNNQYSKLEVEIDTTNYDTISFAYKVSSESGWDYLRFYIDGNEIDKWSGTVNWTVGVYSITGGLHTFEWRYTKDGSVSSGGDCGWIDNVHIYKSE